MMAELFQKSLGIREDGRCHRHPDVSIMEQGSSCLGTCRYCAMEKQKDIKDDTASMHTSTQSFFWSSAASLSLTSSFRQGGTTNGGTRNNTSAQATGEENAEKQQQQQFFESLVARWVQVQDGNLQQSIALSTPLILHELRQLETKVNRQEQVIQQQQETIQELRQSIETKHHSTQELLQTILQTVSQNKRPINQQNDGESSAPPSTRGVPRGSNKRRPSMSSARSACRSVDSGVHKQPLTRHDSNRSFAQEIRAEIALDGSSHSFDRTDLPDLQDIFEEESDLASVQKKRFQIPPSYGKPQRPLEIILESSERQSERKLLPASPEEMGMDMGESLKGNAKAFLAHSPKPRKVKLLENKLEDAADVNVKLSCVTLDAASAASELSDSESGEEEEEEITVEDMDDDFYVNGGGGEDGLSSKKGASWMDDDHDKDEPNDYSIDDLQHVSRYKMVDMYGDRGTYTGTLGLDKDPTGFGTMKYESGRFYKGEWKKGRWNGKGTLLNANGDSYQGDFVSDARHGRGVYRFTSGDVYEGDFFEDNRHGKGKFKFHNGSVYTGDFCMGSFEGHGRYDFEGGFYEGSWKRDEYYGKGKLQYKDGSNYTGKFKRGSAHGFGEERLADGTVRCGLWKRGEFLQKCTEEECKRLESKSAHSSKSKK